MCTVAVEFSARMKTWRTIYGLTELRPGQARLGQPRADGSLRLPDSPQHFAGQVTPVQCESNRHEVNLT